MRKLIIVIYSGGMDSFTVLHKALATLGQQQAGDRIDLEALSFDYGQRHRKELQYAERVTQNLHVPHKIISLASLAPLLRNSALTSPNIPVPEGHYEAESMRQTVVPGRNTLMLSIAMAYAESQILDLRLGYARAEVWYGAHAGDHHIYPDCRPEYVMAMQRVFTTATEDKVSLVVPYLHGNKQTILQDGWAMGLDYAQTWTCYRGESRPCGVCGSCQERLTAFAALGRSDPLDYVSRTLLQPTAESVTT